MVYINTHSHFTRRKIETRNLIIHAQHNRPNLVANFLTHRRKKPKTKNQKHVSQSTRTRRLVHAEGIFTWQLVHIRISFHGSMRQESRSSLTQAKTQVWQFQPENRAAGGVGIVDSFSFSTEGAHNYAEQQGDHVHESEKGRWRRDRWCWWA